ncbi:hypothetical protein ACFWH1_18510 [Streptomyces sp. NPDC127037]|uniref:hypothetical protein n=1 Tax=Streptomyces sp. NPDC127037 TaxID=3347113 RepID=UPI0036566DC9
MRATIRPTATATHAQRRADAEAATAQLVIDQDATYEIAMRYQGERGRARHDSHTLPGDSLRHFLTHFLTAFTPEIKQDRSGKITCWATDRTGRTTHHHTFTKAA